MSQNISQKIIGAHLVKGELKAGTKISIKIDQTLTQDATGTMAWLQFEALGLDKVRNDLAVSYVDHSTLQMDFKNPDDHRFLRTSANAFGGIFSPPGLGICHQLHLENFAKPGATLLGSDSHTPTAGGIASLSMGAGGLSVALAMAGKAYDLTMPQIIEVNLTGKLTGFATAKDIILELLRLLTVKGGVGKIFEYTGEGVESLSVPERATITNMGAELGATGSLFPSDAKTKEFLKAMGREADFVELIADEGASYDGKVQINLSELEPLAACPHMPDVVVKVSELDGLVVDQVAIGSCTNSSFADLALVSNVFKGKQVNAATDTIISPGSKQVLELLGQEGLLQSIWHSGARMLECACGPCIGSGGAPVSNGVSVRTFNRNFEGRSGTNDAKVYLVSPLTAAMAALHGKFTDPKTWTKVETNIALPTNVPSIRKLFVDPSSEKTEIVRGPNIVALEKFDSLPQNLVADIAIKLEDNITTDHIMPAGAEILSYRSNIPGISKFVFHRVDKDFPERAKSLKAGVIVAGENYGQGSSREHAALAPRHLGIRVIITKSFARIHLANLINFGILPLTFADASQYELIKQGASINFDFSNLKAGEELIAIVDGHKIRLNNNLSQDDIETIKCGGLLNKVKAELAR